MSQAKLFTFSASSFHLDPSVESFLKSKGTITLDFGRAAYINSEMMSVVLSELVERCNTEGPSVRDLVTQLKTEVGAYSVERQKLLEENNRLASQVKSYSTEFAALKEQVAGATLTIELLSTENARLQSTLKSAPGTPPTATSDQKMRQSYEKLQKDFQALRAQNAEALTSLKVLEDENEELMLQLEKLKHESINPVVPKAG